MAMYHSWGTQNAWLRQIHGSNRLYVPEPVAKQAGLEDDDWVWAESRSGRIKVQVKLMAGVNPRTVWSWNAIGKRAGAWNIDPAAADITQGFLLNHLIDELLPEQDGGRRYTNSDPITGQAAWYDLKIRIEKAEAEDGRTVPQFDEFSKPAGLGNRPDILRYAGGRRP